MRIAWTKAQGWDGEEGMVLRNKNHNKTSIDDIGRIQDK